MYVELASADLLVRMADCFGLPEPTSSKIKEWFGYYHFENDTRYLAYEPGSQTWSAKSRNGNSSMRFDCEHVPQEKRDHFEECCHLLTMFSPVSKPTDPSVATEGERFIHSDWIFTWFWFPELGRWELACLGDR